MVAHFNPTRALALGAALALALPTLAAPAPHKERADGSAATVALNNGHWVDDTQQFKWKDDTHLGRWGGSQGSGSSAGGSQGTTPVDDAVQPPLPDEADDVTSGGVEAAPVVSSAPAPGPTPVPTPIPSPAPAPVPIPDDDADTDGALTQSVEPSEGGADETTIADDATVVSTATATSPAPTLPVPTDAPVPTGGSQSQTPGELQVVDNCSNSGEVALTYDDGIHMNEGAISDLITGAGGKGTFFFNGMNWECIYDNYQMMRNLFDQGHTIASHTWAHTDITTMSEAELHADLEKLETAFIKILGVKPLWFRPPYGSYNEQSLKVLAERGYKYLAMWSDDSGDTGAGDVEYQKNVMTTAASAYPGPKMILQHSVKESAVEATAWGVQQFTGKGYKLVTVDQCVNGASPYEIVGQPQEPDATWVC